METDVLKDLALMISWGGYATFVYANLLYVLIERTCEGSARLQHIFEIPKKTFAALRYFGFSFGFVFMLIRFTA